MQLIQALRARRLPPPAIAKAIRAAAGATQADVAAELGVHRITVARWEQGERRPRGDLAARYAAVIDQLRREVERRGGGDAH